MQGGLRIPCTIEKTQFFLFKIDENNFNLSKNTHAWAALKPNSSELKKGLIPNYKDPEIKFISFYGTSPYYSPRPWIVIWVPSSPSTYLDNLFFAIL